MEVDLRQNVILESATILLYLSKKKLTCITNQGYTETTTRCNQKYKFVGSHDQYMRLPW